MNILIVPICLTVVSRVSLVPRPCPDFCHLGVHQETRVKHWNDKLSELTVQSKFTDITELKSQNNVWKRIQKGMPAGQLSFLLRAGSCRHTPYSPKLATMEIKARCQVPSLQQLMANCSAHIKWLPCISRTRMVYLAT